MQLSSARPIISNLLRKLKLLYLADWARFYIQKLKNGAANRRFRQENPQVKLPPDYLLYEAYRLDYRKYYEGGRGTAQWLKGYFEKYIDMHGKRILDWGCGPGRIIRHLPQVIGNSCEYYGTDYNKNTIAWCKANLPGIHFNLNTSEAALPYADNFFDVIYGISIFTHFSEKQHFAWYNELCRMLRPGGILFLTSHGDNFKIKLDADELKNYEKGELVVRGNVKEGHRTFTAFHPPAFMAKLFGSTTILEHVSPPAEAGKAIPQDIWIIRK